MTYWAYMLASGKHWRRDWKIVLIEEESPNWDDLYVAMMAVPPGPLTFMGPG